MYNKKLFLLVAPLLASSALLLSSCDKNDADMILRIYNSEDYIYEYSEKDHDEENFVDDIENPDQNKYAYQMDMLDQFKLNWEKKHPGKTVEVIYDTFDTNETMFNELQTGKTTYDVIITSDYMVQKLASKDMLYKFPEEEMEIYWDNISEYMWDKLEPIDIFTNQGVDVGNLTQYCVPYMWGTIGIMYNPAYYIEKAPEFYINKLGDDYDENEDLYDQALDLVIEDFSTWDVFYRTDEGNPYSKSFSIKDSVRDTYTVATIHAEENKPLIDETVRTMGENAPEGIGDIINIPTKDLNNLDVINHKMDVALEDMLALKANAYGFETDSGKTDMTKQYIGANLCWSGDATWAIEEAESSGLDLYFSLPLGDEDMYSASNIWFDCFAMPKNHEGNEISPEQQAQYELTQEFIHFMGMPENAVQNSYCVGYTPATAGEEILEYMLDCYESGRVIDQMKDELENLSIEDFKSQKDMEKYKQELQEEIEYEEEYLANATEDDYYDLSYFFGDEFGDDSIFVPYSYYAQRELAAQFPNIDQLNRLAIMKDFGDKGTQALLDTWETLRTNSLPVWAIVVFAIEGAAGLALAALFITKGVIRKKLKKERK